MCFSVPFKDGPERRVSFPILHKLGIVYWNYFIIYSPLSCYKLVYISLLCQIQIFMSRQIWSTIDFHSIIFLTVKVNGAQDQLGYKIL